MFSVQVLLAIGALALGWIIPRAVRLIGIIYTMVNVNGPNAEAFFASARHSGKVLPWVPLVGRKAHLVMDPSMINKTFLLDRTVLDGHQLFFQLDRILFGGSLDWLNHGAAFEGALASMIVNLRHAGTDELGAAYREALEASFTNLMERMATEPNGKMKSNYTQSLGNTFADSTQTAFFGPHPVATVRDLYYAYDVDAHMFGAACCIPLLPDRVACRLLSKKSFDARDQLIEEWMQWLDRTDVEIMPKALGALIKVAKEGGFNRHDVAALMVTAQFAIQSNSTRTIYWMILHLIQSPTYLARARKEITEYRKKNGEDNIADATFNNLPSRLPFLTSLLYETLRHDGSAYTVRQAMQDVTLQSDTPGVQPFKVRNGELVFLCAAAGTFDPNLFENPEIFQADRFIKENGHFSAPTTIRPFGAGPGVCKGRAFVIAQEIQFVLRMLELFDISVLTPSQQVSTKTVIDGHGHSAALPTHRPGLIGSGIMQPTYEVELEIRQRE